MNETVRTQDITKLVASILLRIIRVIWISLGLHLEAFAIDSYLKPKPRTSFYRTRSPLQDKYKAINIRYTQDLFYTYHYT